MDLLIARGANTVALETIAAQEAMRTVNDSPPCEGVYQTTVTPEPQVRVDPIIAEIDILVKVTFMAYTFCLGSATIRFAAPSHIIKYQKQYGSLEYPLLHFTSLTLHVQNSLRTSDTLL